MNVLTMVHMSGHQESFSSSRPWVLGRAEVMMLVERAQDGLHPEVLSS